MKHSKFRNTGLLFEALIQKLVSEILKEGSPSKSYHLIKKYFAKDTELYKENLLYNELLNSNVKPDMYPKLIELVASKRKSLNSYKLKSEKYNLVKEIKKHYNDDNILNIKSNKYRLFGNIYQIFENSEISSSEYINNLESLSKQIIEYRNATAPKIKTELSEINTNDRKLVFKYIIDNFNKKYKELIPEQKELIKNYIEMGVGTLKFKNYLNKVIEESNIKIQNISKNITDIPLKSKLNEIIKLSNLIKTKKITDDHITGLLQILELTTVLK